MAVLEEALRHQNIIIDYVCMSEDERQDFRARLFSRWFRDYADDSKYSLLTTSLKVGNVTNYLGAFLRRDNELYMTSLFPSNNKLYPRIRMVENSGIRSILCDRSFFLFL